MAFFLPGVPVLDDVKSTITTYFAHMSASAFTLNSSPVTYDGMPMLKNVNMINGRGKFPNNLHAQSPNLEYLLIPRLKPNAFNTIGASLSNMEHLIEVDLRFSWLLILMEYDNTYSYSLILTHTHHRLYSYALQINRDVFTLIN